MEDQWRSGSSARWRSRPTGRLIAAIGGGQTTGDGKANAIVALDPKTLQLKDWFTQPTAEFVTGPTILRHNDKEVVAAATKDGRIMLLDAASLGGSNHSTPLLASKPLAGAGATCGCRCARNMAAVERACSDLIVDVDSSSGVRPRRRRQSRRQRCDHQRRRHCPEPSGCEGRALAGAGVGLSRPRVAGDADHRQRCRVHARNGHVVDRSGARNSGRAPRVRRRRRASDCGPARSR